MKQSAFEGKNSIVTLESDYPSYVFAQKKYYVWWLKKNSRLKPLFSWSNEEEFFEEARRWVDNERIWNLIKEDIIDFAKWRYGKVPIFEKERPFGLREALKELEEYGYNAEEYSPYKIYESGAILQDGRIVEIDGDDHSILKHLPNRLTYRFVEHRRNLYFRVPTNYTNIQLETAIRISPERFNYVAIDILDRNGELIKSCDKEFILGTKTNLLRMFYTCLGKG